MLWLPFNPGFGTDKDRATLVDSNPFNTRMNMRNMYKKISLASFAISLVLYANLVWSEKQQEQVAVTNGHETVIFAGGCFWCMEPPFDKLEGVVSTVSGYTGGHTENPSYKQVSADTTGHFEAVAVTYDPTKVDYATLLNVFWHNVDPLDAKGQFCDKGNSYRTAIFYQNEAQQKLAENSKTELEDSEYLIEPIATQILQAQTFYPAEGYHQTYYQVNPVRYKYYRFACGRDNRLKELWKDSAGKGGALVPSSSKAN